MPAETRHRLNARTAAAKVIDGEAIVINVVTGCYYSLDGAGGLAWLLLVGGATATEAGETIAARYAVDPGDAAADVERLSAELIAEDLVVVVDAHETHGADLPPVPEDRAQYAAPVLLTFTDMEELLAFDPPLPLADYPVWESSDSRS